MMVEMTVSDAREKMSRIVEAVLMRAERTVLTKNGRRVAALVSIEDLEYLQELEDEADSRLMDAVLKKGSSAVPWDEAKKSLGL